jgi:hypothetical protein
LPLLLPLRRRSHFAVPTTLQMIFSPVRIRVYSAISLTASSPARDATMSNYKQLACEKNIHVYVSCMFHRTDCNFT